MGSIARKQMPFCIAAISLLAVDASAYASAQDIIDGLAGRVEELRHRRHQDMDRTTFGKTHIQAQSHLARIPPRTNPRATSTRAGSRTVLATPRALAPHNSASQRGLHEFPDLGKLSYADDLYSTAMIGAMRLAMGSSTGWQSPARFLGGVPGESYAGLIQETYKLLETAKGNLTEATERILNVLRAFPTSPRLLGANEISYQLLGFLTPVLMRFLVGDCTSENYKDENGGKVRGRKVTIARCRFLEESKCKSVCGLCKHATEAFFNKEMHIPMSLEPNFKDCSCVLVWGKAPTDALSDQDPRCYNACARFRSEASNPGCSLVEDITRRDPASVSMPSAATKRSAGDVRRPLTLRRSPARLTAVRATVARSLRNVDLPEVVFFDETVVFGSAAVEKARAASSGQVDGRAAAEALVAAEPRADVLRFAADCRSAGALIATTSLLGEEAAAAVGAAFGADASFSGASKEALFARAFKEMIVQPRGFGNAPPPAPRLPEPKWCVTLEAEDDGALAARKLGMRCLGIGDDDVLEAHAHVESLQGLVCDDIATPGAFWLQPLLPEAVEEAIADDAAADTPADRGMAQDDDEELRSILADMDAP